jgi:hypothetical protein
MLTLPALHQGIALHPSLILHHVTFLLHLGFEFTMNFILQLVPLLPQGQFVSF